MQHGATTEIKGNNMLKIKEHSNRRIMEWFDSVLEGTFKGHPIQLPCNGQGHHRPDQVAQSYCSNLTLNVFRDRAPSTSLDKPVPVPYHCHCKKCLPYIQSESVLF